VWRVRTRRTYDNLDSRLKTSQNLSLAIISFVSAPPPRARVAVVIVNYQSYDELRSCLASVERAEGPLEVVVIDHASDVRAADDIASHFPAFHMLRKPGNHGFAAGVNAGAAETRAPYLLLLNPDCMIEPDVPARLIDALESDPSAAVVGPKIRNADGTIQKSARRFPDLTTGIAGRTSWLTRVWPGNPLSKHNLPVQAGERATVSVDWVSGACMLVRRASFEAIGGMDEGFFLYWEDADFCRRLKNAGSRTLYCPSAAATHMVGRSSRHAADASLEAFHASAYRLFCKHTSLPIRLLAPLVFAGLRVRLAFMKRLVRIRKEQT
jgi:GT2 family glycosyltransferase